MIADRLARRTPGLATASRTVLVAATALLATACGKEIGDECIVSTDCGSDVNLVCDVASLNGYCTIPGCDYGTCPDEAVCVRFFTASFENLPCNPATEDLEGAGSTNDCGLDETCTLNGQCVPASSETRFCMKTCGDSSDCRDGYECRDETLMRMHGGEPVPPPGQRVMEFDSFCAEAPVSL